MKKKTITALLSVAMLASSYATDSITLDKGFSVPKGAEVAMDICNGFPDRMQ